MKLRMVHLLVFFAVPACAMATVDDEGEVIGDGDGDGDMGSGGLATGNGGGGVLATSGGAPMGNGGGLVTSGGTSSGGAATGGGSSGGAGSGGAGSGGAASGGAPSSGGAPGAGGTDAGGCPTVAFNMNSGELGTTGEGCFSATSKPVNGWGAYNCDGRTITINDVVTTPGTGPSNINWSGSAPYLVEFSAGQYAYCSFSYY